MRGWTPVDSTPDRVDLRLNDDAQRRIDAGKYGAWMLAAGMPMPRCQASDWHEPWDSAADDARELIH